MVAVRTNGLISEYFPLHRGKRQGCWLSPFLFDIAIEPLAIAIRLVGRIKRYPGVKQTIKLCFMLMICFCKYQTQLRACPTFSTCCKNSVVYLGIKLIYQNLLLFPLNNLAREITHENMPFKIENDKFTYLGIEIDRSI